MTDRILAYVKAAETAVANVKPVIESYLKDTNIPLDRRWELFVSLPEYLKNHEPYIWRSEVLPEDFIMYDGDYSAERYQTVKTVDIVEHVFGGKWDWKNDVNINYNIDINALKEEILAINLGSFVCDW